MRIQQAEVQPALVANPRLNGGGGKSFDLHAISDFFCFIGLLSGLHARHALILAQGGSSVQRVNVRTAAKNMAKFLVLSDIHDNWSALLTVAALIRSSTAATRRFTRPLLNKSSKMRGFCLEINIKYPSRRTTCFSKNEKIKGNVIDYQPSLF
uniref:hypothetical protein n=1 Tax=Candidatus Electronema sp. TaxID=2698783 RepID=UPI0040572C15